MRSWRLGGTTRLGGDGTGTRSLQTHLFLSPVLPRPSISLSIWATPHEAEHRRGMNNSVQTTLINNSSYVSTARAGRRIRESFHRRDHMESSRWEWSLLLHTACFVLRGVQTHLSVTIEQSSKPTPSPLGHRPCFLAVAPKTEMLNLTAIALRQICVLQAQIQVT